MKTLNAEDAERAEISLLRVLRGLLFKKCLMKNMQRKDAKTPRRKENLTRQLLKRFAPLCLCAIALNAFFSFSLSAQPERMAGFFLPQEAAGAPAWWPTNVGSGNCACFFYHGDLPPNATFYGWTNEMTSGEVYTNQGGSINNSSAGVFFPGTAGNYLLNAASTLSMSNTVVSLWIAVDVTSYSGLSYGAILGTANSSGYGLYARSAVPSDIILNSTSDVVAAVPPTNTLFTIAILAGNSPLTAYTNAVVSTSGLPYANVANGTLWGIGRDADSDQLCPMYVHSFGLWTNHYVLTATDLANLQSWLATHP